MKRGMKEGRPTVHYSSNHFNNNTELWDKAAVLERILLAGVQKHVWHYDSFVSITTALISGKSGRNHKVFPCDCVWQTALIFEILFAAVLIDINMSRLSSFHTEPEQFLLIFFFYGQHLLTHVKNWMQTVLWCHFCEKHRLHRW